MNEKERERERASYPASLRSLLPYIPIISIRAPCSIATSCSRHALVSLQVYVSRVP